MRIRLRTLFLVTTLAAVITYWVTTRKTQRLPNALLQTIPTALGSENQVSRSAVLVDYLYNNLLRQLESKRIGNKVLNSRNPLDRLQETIRFKCAEKDDGTVLVTVSMWGNPIVGNDDELRDIMKVAIESFSTDPPDGTRVKLLNVPLLTKSITP